MAEQESWTAPVPTDVPVAQEVKPRKPKMTDEQKATAKAAREAAKPPKPPKVEKVPGEKKVAKGSNKFPNTAVITLISTTNPKRSGSAAAADWENYENGMTVQQALDKFISLADIYYNASHGFLTVEGYSAPAPKKKPKKEKVAAAVTEQPAAQ
jgi:hypothetical protein